MFTDLPIPEEKSPLDHPASAGSGEAWNERLWLLLAIGLGLAIATVLTIHRLQDCFGCNTYNPQYLSRLPSWHAAFESLKPVLPQTAWAAVKVWTFWGFSTAIVAGLLLRIDPELGLGDAILGGASGIWAIAYVMGQALGPIGLFRAPVIWALLALGALWLWRRPPAIKVAPLDSGQKLALLTFAVLAVGLLPMQLASPVVPFMDVLSYPASMQRILTFGVYLPFDNDPYGCWGPYAQTPALELFYTMLALGSHIRLAVLAESAAIVPMAALLIFATYRLGRTLLDESAGGVATLLLFVTVLFRRLHGMRGTAVGFALVGIGLAFFLDSSRSRTRMALGAVLLGTAVASHAIIGGLAMILAGFGVLLWLAAGDFWRFRIGTLCLLGAALISVPEFAIGLAKPLPYPAMPLSQIAGIGIIWLSAAKLRVAEPAARKSKLTYRLNCALIVLLIGAVLYRQATVQGSLFERLLEKFPLLMLFGFGGLLALLAAKRERLGAPESALIAVALLFGIGREYVGDLVAALRAGPMVSAAIYDIGIKLDDYWCPYFLVFAAAALFLFLYRHASKPLAVLALLVLLNDPLGLGRKLKDDSVEHSIPKEWGIDLGNAISGYWRYTHDSRWTLDSAGFAMVDVLRAEIAAGRISPATHILHIARDVIVYNDMVRFSVFTGIADDPIVFNVQGWETVWLAGGRVRHISQLAQALAEKPPYILEQTAPPPWMPQPPPGYEEIFHRDYLRLFRLKTAKQ